MINLIISFIVSIIIVIVTLNIYDVYNAEEYFTTGDYVYFIIVALLISGSTAYICTQNIDNFFSNEIISGNSNFIKGPAPF